jgi:hypothetical protein
VWDFTAGSEPTYLSGSKQLTGRPYNVVVARGEPADTDPDVPVKPPVEVTVADDDPTSASYVGLVGRRPYFLTSGYIESAAQARDAALAQLNRTKGLAEVVTISAVTHPARDVWQVCRAVDPELAVDARYVVDRVSMPLRGGRSTLTTRRRRL